MQKLESKGTDVYKCLWCQAVWTSFEELTYWSKKGCPRCGRHTILVIGRTV